MEDFNYTYSAKEQEEIKAIRKKYIKPEEDKMALLRRMDAGVTKKATVVSLVFGILGALLLGIGMCFILTPLAASMGLSDVGSFVVGIPVGVFGIVLVSLAYPCYNAVLKREREKIAPEILRLTDALSK